MTDLHDDIEDIELRIDRLVRAENARHTGRVKELSAIRAKLLTEARVSHRRQRRMREVAALLENAQTPVTPDGHVLVRKGDFEALADAFQSGLPNG